MELSPYYEKKVDCLHCKRSFKSLKVRKNAIRIASTDSDFRPTYVDTSVNGLFYNVFVCEHCGYSFTEDFTPYFAPGVLQQLNEQVCARWIPHHFNGERSIHQAIQSYKLAFLCGSIKKEKHIILAGLLLRLAWLYRDLQNKPQEQRFLRMARQHYSDSYSNGDYEKMQMSEMRVLYMVAELSFRLGDIEQATRYFSRIIERQSIGGDAKIVDLAKERWEKVREIRERQRAQQHV